jgi:hypothetical protein
MHCWATDKDDPTVQERWGRVGKQRIEDTGPLNTKRMETCDDEFAKAAKDFIKRQTDQDLQKSHRWLQPGRLPDRAREGEPAQTICLFER